MAHIKLATLIVALSIGLVGCGDGDRFGPTATAPIINCKSPVDNSSVPKEVALTQARRMALRLGDGASNVVNVDCGDEVIVVAPTPSEVIVPPLPK